MKNFQKVATKGTIWILNHYASHLEQRHLELGKVFADNGYEVVVVTSAFEHGSHNYLYDENIKMVEKSDHVTFVYLRTNPAYKNSGIKRVLNMLSFCWMVINHERTLVARFGKPSFVIGSSAHPFTWEAAYWVSKRNGARFIAEFRDIWPMSLVDIQGMSPKHPLVLLLDVIERRAYRHANVIVGTMPYAYKHVCDNLGFPREKMFWMPNGIAVDRVREDMDIPTSIREYLEKNWCCLYIGSLVKSENLFLILEAMQKLKDDDIHLAIVGDGNLREEIETYLLKNRIDKVRVFSKVSREQVHSVIHYAKCCVASCAEKPIYQYGLSMNKLNDYLVLGKPIVFACSCPSVVDSTDSFVVGSTDAAAFAEALRKYRNMTTDELTRVGQTGRKVIEESYDYNKIGQKYLEMMETIR